MERERGIHKNTHITYRSKRSRTCGGGTISYTCSTRGFPGFFQLAKNWRMISARLCAILVEEQAGKVAVGPRKTPLDLVRGWCQEVALEGPRAVSL